MAVTCGNEGIKSVWENKGARRRATNPGTEVGKSVTVKAAVELAFVRMFWHEIYPC